MIITSSCPNPMSDLLVKHSKQLLAILVKLQALEYPLHFLQMLQDCLGLPLYYNCSSISGERKIFDIPVLLMKMAVVNGYGPIEIPIPPKLLPESTLFCPC